MYVERDERRGEVGYMSPAPGKIQSSIVLAGHR